MLFTNTKGDVGPCNLLHDDWFKKEYEEKASKREKRIYEDGFVVCAQDMLADVEKRIKRAKERLEMDKLQKIDKNLNNELHLVDEEMQVKIKTISDEIERQLQQIEKLGFEGLQIVVVNAFCKHWFFFAGKVEEAGIAMSKVEDLKEQCNQIKREYANSQPRLHNKAEPGTMSDKLMEVCDVCGAILIVNDVQQRIEDHLAGKKHVGFSKIKVALEEMLNRRKAEMGADNQKRSSTDVHRSSDRKRGYDCHHHKHGHDRKTSEHRRRSPAEVGGRHFRHDYSHHGKSHRKRERSRSPFSSSKLYRNC